MGEEFSTAAIVVGIISGMVANFLGSQIANLWNKFLSVIHLRKGVNERKAAEHEARVQELINNPRILQFRTYESLEHMQNMLKSWVFAFALTFALRWYDNWLIDAWFGIGAVIYIYAAIWCSARHKELSSAIHEARLRIMQNEST